MSLSHHFLRSIRTIHLYLGVFTAPMLLFFAITGGLQSFSLHETTRGSSYTPPAWLASMAQLHKKQTIVIPVRRQRPPEAQLVLRRMADSVAHRGPDEMGFYSNGEISIGHRRLSIVGLADGQQPMQCDDGNFVIGFNGEIFNYLELRADLEARGERFRTGSDTEVLLRLFVRDGEAAFAAHDSPRACRLLESARPAAAHSRNLAEVLRRDAERCATR